LIKILYAVLGLYILIKFYTPVVDEIKNIKKQIFLINQNIEKNRFFLNESKKIDMIYKKSIQIDKENRQYFFLPSQTSSQIFTQLQLTIKTNLDKYSIYTKYIRWLDIQNNNFFKKYPIKISVKATPNSFSQFINDLCKNDKLIYIDNIKIKAINPRKKITYELIISGYQLKGNK